MLSQQYRRYGILIALIALLRPTAARTETPSPVALEVLSLSGLERQLAEMEGQVVQGITAQGARVSGERQKLLVQAAQKAYAADRLRSEALKIIESEIASAKVDKGIAWLRSPLGKRITALEEHATTAEGVAELQTFAQLPSEKQADPARRALVQRLDTATGAADTLVNVMLGTTLGVAVALNGASTAPQPIAVIRESVEAQREQMRAAVGPMTAMSFTYTYRELTDREFLDYVEFYESKGGRSYNAMMTRAFTGALTAAATRLGTTIADDLRRMAAEHPI